MDKKNQYDWKKKVNKSPLFAKNIYIPEGALVQMPFHITFPWRKHMNKKELEKQNQQKNHNEFNSITQKVKPENQNQEHNVRKEGIQPINQKR